MAELKREYVIPLRRKTRKAPKWRRSKKAVAVLKDFVRKNMKSEDVIVCNELNEHIWANGSKNPPGKVSVVALKTPINGVEKVLVNLVDKGVENQKALYEKDLPSVGESSTQEAEVTKEETKEEVTKDSKEKSNDESIEEKDESSSTEKEEVSSSEKEETSSEDKKQKGGNKE